MSFKSLFVAIVGCIISFTVDLSGQTSFEIKEGKVQKKNNSPLEEVIGNDGEFTYVIRQRKNNQYLEKIDNELNTVESLKIPARKEINGDKHVYSGLYMFHNHICMFTKVTRKEAKESITYMQLINKNSLKFQDTIKEVLRSEYDPEFKIVWGNSFNSRILNDMTSTYAQKTCYISADNSHLLVYENLAYSNAEWKEKLKVAVYDTTFNKEWEKTIELPYEAKEFTVTSLVLSNDGDLYVYGELYKIGSEKLLSKIKGKTEFTYRLLAFKENGQVFKNISLELDKKFVTDLRLEIGNDGNPIAVGFYSDKGLGSIKGAFYMVVDKDQLQITIKKTVQFDNSFIQSNLKQGEKLVSNLKSKTKSGAEMKSYDLSGVIIKKEGGAILVAEQYYIIVHTHVRSDGSSTTTTTYIYNDIILVDFDKQGNLMWKTKISKRQTSKNDFGARSSFTMVYSGNKLFFIYNDNPKNENLEKGKAAKSAFSKKIALMITEVDTKDGSISRSIAFTRHRRGITMQPRVGLQTDKSTAFLYGQKRKNGSQFLKIIFAD